MINPSVYKQKFELRVPSFPPLGLLYIGRSLEDEGHQAEIIDFNMENNPMNKIEINLKTVDVVGISVDNDTYNESSEIASFIKKNDPSIPIIIGGPHCTIYKEKTLTNLPDADVSVSGDGEIAIKEIARAIEEGKCLSKINGIYYRENKKIKSGKPPRLIENLDEIPFPSRHLVNKYIYGKFGKQNFYRPRLTSIITTRGCPFRCRYCTRHIVSSGRFRQRSAENIIEELIEIDGEYGSVMIGDDSFLADQKRAHLIFDGIIRNNLNLDLLIGGARVDSANHDLYQKMKKANVKYINYGIESGNQETLDFYNKKITTDQIKYSVKLADEMGFFTTGTFILGAPFETEEHIERTVNFASSLPLDLAAFYPLSYRHGSDLWREAVQNGILSECEHEVVSDKNRGLGNFSREDLLKICNQSSKMFYKNPKYLMRQIMKACRLNNFSILKAGINSKFNKFKQETSDNHIV